MNTDVRQRFINNVNMAGFVQAGVMQSISLADQNTKKTTIYEDKDSYPEIVVGKTKVGERCRVGGRIESK